MKKESHFHSEKKNNSSNHASSLFDNLLEKNEEFLSNSSDEEVISANNETVSGLQKTRVPAPVTFPVLHTGVLDSVLRNRKFIFTKLYTAILEGKKVCPDGFVDGPIEEGVLSFRRYLKTQSQRRQQWGEGLLFAGERIVLLCLLFWSALQLFFISGTDSSTEFNKDEFLSHSVSERTSLDTIAVILLFLACGKFLRDFFGRQLPQYASFKAYLTRLNEVEFLSDREKQVILSPDRKDSRECEQCLQFHLSFIEWLLYESNSKHGDGAWEAAKNIAIALMNRFEFQFEANENGSAEEQLLRLKQSVFSFSEEEFRDQENDIYKSTLILPHESYDLNFMEMPCKSLEEMSQRGAQMRLADSKPLPRKPLSYQEVGVRIVSRVSYLLNEDPRGENAKAAYLFGFLKDLLFEKDPLGMSELELAVASFQFLNLFCAAIDRSQWHNKNAFYVKQAWHGKAFRCLTAKEQVCLIYILMSSPSDGDHAKLLARALIDSEHFPASALAEFFALYLNTFGDLQFNEEKKIKLFLAQERSRSLEIFYKKGRPSEKEYQEVVAHRLLLVFEDKGSYWISFKTKNNENSKTISITHYRYPKLRNLLEELKEAADWMRGDLFQDELYNQLMNLIAAYQVDLDCSIQSTQPPAIEGHRIKIINPPDNEDLRAYGLYFDQKFCEQLYFLTRNYSRMSQLAQAEVIPEVITTILLNLGYFDSQQKLRQPFYSLALKRQLASNLQEENSKNKRFYNAQIYCVSSANPAESILVDKTRNQAVRCVLDWLEKNFRTPVLQLKGSEKKVSARSFLMDVMPNILSFIEKNFTSKIPDPVYSGLKACFLDSKKEESAFSDKKQLALLKVYFNWGVGCGHLAMMLDFFVLYCLATRQPIEVYEEQIVELDKQHVASESVQLLARDREEIEEEEKQQEESLYNEAEVESKSSGSKRVSLWEENALFVELYCKWKSVSREEKTAGVKRILVSDNNRSGEIKILKLRDQGKKPYFLKDPKSLDRQQGDFQLHARRLFFSITDGDAQKQVIKVSEISTLLFPNRGFFSLFLTQYSEQEAAMVREALRTSGGNLEGVCAAPDLSTEEVMLLKVAFSDPFEADAFQESFYRIVCHNPKKYFDCASFFRINSCFSNRIEEGEVRSFLSRYVAVLIAAAGTLNRKKELDKILLLRPNFVVEKGMSPEKITLFSFLCKQYIGFRSNNLAWGYRKKWFTDAFYNEFALVKGDQSNKKLLVQENQEKKETKQLFIHRAILEIQGGLKENFLELVQKPSVYSKAVNFAELVCTLLFAVHQCAGDVPSFKKGLDVIFAEIFNHLAEPKPESAPILAHLVLTVMYFLEQLAAQLPPEQKEATWVLEKMAWVMGRFSSNCAFYVQSASEELPAFLSYCSDQVPSQVWRSPVAISLDYASQFYQNWGVSFQLSTPFIKMAALFLSKVFSAEKEGSHFYCHKVRRLLLNVFRSHVELEKEDLIFIVNEILPYFMKIDFLPEKEDAINEEAAFFGPEQGVDDFILDQDDFKYDEEEEKQITIETDNGGKFRFPALFPAFIKMIFNLFYHLDEIDLTQEEDRKRVSTLSTCFLSMLRTGETKKAETIVQNLKTCIDQIFSDQQICRDFSRDQILEATSKIVAFSLWALFDDASLLKKKNDFSLFYQNPDSDLQSFSSVCSEILSLQFKLEVAEENARPLFKEQFEFFSMALGKLGLEESVEMIRGQWECMKTQLKLNRSSGREIRNEQQNLGKKVGARRKDSTLFFPQSFITTQQQTVPLLRNDWKEKKTNTYGM